MVRKKWSQLDSYNTHLADISSLFYYVQSEIQVICNFRDVADHIITKVFQVLSVLCGSRNIVLVRYRHFVRGMRFVLLGSPGVLGQVCIEKCFGSISPRHVGTV